MPEKLQVYIRLAESGMAFIYTVVENGAVIASKAITPVADEVLDGYYGGSQVTD